MRLEKGEEDPDSIINQLFRRAHTLKGAAFMVHQEDVGRIAHSLEDCLSWLKKEDKTPSTDTIDKMLDAVRTLKLLLKALEGGSVHPSKDELEKVLQDLKQVVSQKHSSAPTADQKRARKLRKTNIPERENSIETVQKALKSEASDTTKLTPPRPEKETMRVKIENLDALMNISGEFIIHRFKLNNLLELIKSANSEFNQLYFLLNRCNNIAEEPLIKDRLKELPGGTELMEILKSMGGRYIRELLQTIYDEFSRMLLNINNLSRRLSSEVTEVRLLPASVIFDELKLFIRDLSRSSNRSVNFITEGGDTQVDIYILNEMSDILLHLIRNSIDHGIEAPHIRRRRGKPEDGTVILRLRRIGNQIEVTCEDDGAGINISQIRKEAVRQGFFTKLQVMQMDDQEALNRIIMEPGFSTSRKITDLSGSGFGLDTVKAWVDRMKGDIRVDTVRGRYTRITIKVPLSVSTLSGLLVKCSHQRFVIPMNLVVETLQISRDDVFLRESRHYLKRGNTFVPLIHLADILELPKLFSPGRKTMGVVVYYHNRRIAIGVDDLIGTQEIAVKNLGDHLKKVNCISSCTVLSDGAPVLILEVPDLIRKAYRVPISRPIYEPDSKEQLPVLVVDDSTTSRILEKSILEAEGFDVHVATSGEDAIPLLRQNRYSSMIFNIDLPGIDGIELLKKARSTGVNTQVPIIMISSKEDKETIRKCYENGAIGYIVKSRFNQQEFVKMVKSFSS